MMTALGLFRGTRSCPAVNSGTLRDARLKDCTILPKRATDGSAGYDIFATETHTIPAGGKGIIPLHISIMLPVARPFSCYARMAPRSGLAAKKHINVGAGVIDADYRGNIGVILFNHGQEPLHVAPGDAIAQLILEMNLTPELQEVAVDTLTSTKRGSNGYGSTGMPGESRNTPESLADLPMPMTPPQLSFNYPNIDRATEIQPTRFDGTLLLRRNASINNAKPTLRRSKQ